MEYLLFQEEEIESSRKLVQWFYFHLFKYTNDNDLIKIYNYYNYKGYYNIVSIQVINLCTTIFLYIIFICSFMY